MSFSPGRFVHISRGLSQPDHAIAKLPAMPFAQPSQEALIGGDEAAVSLGCKGKVEAVICRMIELDRGPRRRLEQGTCRHQLEISGLEKPCRKERFIL